TDTAHPTVTSNSNDTTVAASAATQFQVSTCGSITAHDPCDITVRAVNDNNHLDAGYRGTIHFTSTDGAAGLPANYTFLAGDAGTHTFSPGVTYNTAGNQHLNATDTAHPAVTGVSNTTNVSPAVATHFDVSSGSSVTAGQNLPFTVTARDANGHVVPS